MGRDVGHGSESATIGLLVMLFHTWPFLIFFAIVLTGYWSLRAGRFWLHWLLAASLFFYGFWSPWYLLLIVYSTLVDYVCVQMMDRPQAGLKLSRKVTWLWGSLVNNLGLLAYFKYTNFFLDNANWLGRSFGLDWELPLQEIVLPVGISFFTFQSMSYSIDFYGGQIEREKSFVRFATFVAFFPQLVAGPVERARELLPQLARPRPFEWSLIADGASLFLTGLFKKVALSNYLAAYADPIFNVPERHSGAHLAMATFAFAWQIYFDFSGYTDMARGVARAMGFDLMLNFRHPYLATGFGDFWSRWHISLSSWFRDYVYIPLGGSRCGALRTYVNLFVVMVISGFWHGANWTFVVWGVIHGVAAIVTRSLERSAWYRDRFPTILKQVFVFLVVCIGWIYFRADSLTTANRIVAEIVTGSWKDPGFPVLLWGLVLSVWAYQWISESRFQWITDSGLTRVVLAILMFLYIACVPGEADQPFIYFQF